MESLLMALFQKPTEFGDERAQIQQSECLTTLHPCYPIALNRNHKKLMLARAFQHQMECVYQ